MMRTVELANIKDLEKYNIPGIYSIKNINNGKMYVGQAINIFARLLQHINSNAKSKGIDKAIFNEGADKFIYTVEIAYPHLSATDSKTIETLNQSEWQFIDRYDSYKNGYNKTSGNHRNKKFEINSEFKFVPIDMIFGYNNMYNIKREFNKNILLVNKFDDEFVKFMSHHDCKIVQIKENLDKKELGKYILERLHAMNLKDFDIIISNPPYGKIGAEITDIINKGRKENSTFINIMPVNDYKRVDNLWEYVDIESRQDADFYKYGIAGVTSDIIKMSKTPREYVTKDIFEIETWRFSGKNVYKKYFYETRRRSNQAIDDAWLRPSVKTLQSSNITVDNSFAIHFRTPNHLAHNGSFGKENSVEYKWNVERSLDKQYILNNHCNNGNHSTFGFITFNTPEERDNFTNFILNDGYKFFKRICEIAHPDSSIIYGKIMPKVDWTKSWTVKDLLKDYGYSNEEIQEIIDDIK